MPNTTKMDNMDAINVILQRFTTALVKGETIDIEVLKSTTHLLCMNKTTHKHLKDLQANNPVAYAAYRAPARDATVREHKPDWGKPSLQDCLESKGLLTADAGRDWYASHFKGWALVSVLTKAGLIEGCTRDWLVEALRGYWSNELYSALYRAKLLTKECGRDWYTTYFKGTFLLMVLEDAGYLTRDTPLEWFETVWPPLAIMIDGQNGHDGGYFLYRALRSAGYLTPDMGFGWYASRFDGKALYDAVKHGQAFGCDNDRHAIITKFKKTVVMADVILDAGWLNETKDWYAQHVPKRDLASVLKRACLWNADLGKDWIARKLMKCDVFHALVEFNLFGGCTVDWIKKNVAKRKVDAAIAMITSV